MMNGSKSGTSRRRSWRWWAGRTILMLVVLGAGGGAVVWWKLPRPDQTVTIPCEIAGETRPVHVDCFYPGGTPGPRPLPTIMILHGVEGAHKYHWLHHGNARRIADQGYAVFFIHYFETGDYETIPVHNAQGQVDLTGVDHCIECDRARWIETAAKMIRAVAERPEVDRQRVGVLGYSLGCFVGLSATNAVIASEPQLNVAAFAGNWGAMFKDAEFAPRFPPVRMFHGAQDALVQCSLAQRTAAHLQQLGLDCELQVYPGQGHVLRDAAGDDSYRRMMAFFAEKLQPLR